MNVKKLVRSFKYAFSGIYHTVRTEQNMRIHLSVANLIIAFAYFYGISRIEWAILFVTIAAVFFAESVNTATERLADTYTTEYSVGIKHAKDAAAGGVTLVCAASVAVGFALFFDIEKIAETLTYIIKTPHAALICLALLAADTVLLIFGGKRNRKENKNEEE